MTKQQKAYLLMSFVILFWSSVATAFKLALETVNPFQLLLFSVFIANIVFLSALAKQNKIHLIKEMSASSIRHNIFVGILNPFLFYLILFHAYDLLPGQIAMTLNFSWPIAMSLMAIFFQKQKLNRKTIFSLLLGFAGVVLIATRGEWFRWDNFNIWGIVLIMISTLIWSLYWMLNVRDTQDALIKLSINFASGFIALLIFFPFLSEWHWPNLKEWGYLIYVGFFEMGFSYILWLKALELTKSTVKISILIFIIPFLSLLFLHLILEEAIFYSTFIGVLLVISAILIPQSNALRKKQEREA